MDYVRSPSRLAHYFKDTRSLYYYANKATRHPSLRDMVFKTIRFFLPKSETASVSGTELDTLRRDGFVFWPQLLDAAKVKRIRDFLDTKQVHDSRDFARHPLTIAELDPAKTQKLKYFEKDLVQCEDLMRIANDPHIIGLISAQFGCKPTICCMEAWWTKAGTAIANELYQDDMYHRDVEDFKFIKLFIYLCDVEEANGAHCFIKGSQNSTRLTKRMPIPDQLASENFAEKDHFVFTGKAGSGFLESTWGLHRSLPIRKGERLLYSVTYSLTSMNPQSPKAPLAKNTLGLDAYTNRVYFS